MGERDSKTLRIPPHKGNDEGRVGVGHHKGHGYSRKEKSSNPDRENSSGFGQVRLGWEKCLGKRRVPGRCPAKASLRKLGLLNHKPSSFSTGPHWAIARDVQATGIRCPSECLQKSRSHLNSRDDEFTHLHPRTENDIISPSLATLPSHFLQWLQLSSHFSLCTHTIFPVHLV